MLWRLLATVLLGISPAKATVFVHLFEWSWNDIAQECEEFLGPKGYFAVQLSPPNEHRFLLGRPWYERYQPVSYQLTSRSGTRQEFIQMVQRCHQAGVQIYADAVINHMASCRPACDAAQPQFGNRGVGGSTYNLGQYQFDNLFDEEDRNRLPGALNAFHQEHFHHGCNQVSDWNNPWQVQNCELERLADLATEREDVQNTIANYLVALLALGVDGLRIDAAKHFPPGDLHAILTKAAIAANVRIEGTDINPGGAQDSAGISGDHRQSSRPPRRLCKRQSLRVRIWQEAGRKIPGWAAQPAEWTGTLSARAGSCSPAWSASPSSITMTISAAMEAAGQTIKDMRNNLSAYTLANIFMLAWPYGYPNVMSSYRFGNGERWLHDQNAEQDITSVASMPVQDDFLGPPHNGLP